MPVVVRQRSGSGVYVTTHIEGALIFIEKVVSWECN
jgi:hypothetical protein